jgi:hypothetical protein
MPADALVLITSLGARTATAASAIGAVVLCRILGLDRPGGRRGDDDCVIARRNGQCPSMKKAGWIAPAGLSNAGSEDPACNC